MVIKDTNNDDGEDYDDDYFDDDYEYDEFKLTVYSGDLPIDVVGSDIR